jgi:Xaa-Pro aminopeptidase
VLRIGEPMMFDALSQYRRYHGDYGRTIVVGEPSPLVRSRAGALKAGWDAVLEKMRPGVATQTLRDTLIATIHGSGLPEFAGPSIHNLGLQHTDDPHPIAMPHPFKPSIVLEPGMVLNVDIPYEEEGWGSIHREDTVLITDTGCEALTKVDDTLIVV